MRTRFVFCAALLLTACAGAPRQAAVPAAETPAAAPAASAGEAYLRAPGGELAEAERLFGPPDLRRAEGAGAALTYRLDQCALLLLFQQQDGRLRLAAAYPSARQAGAPAPSLAQCAAEAEARRAAQNR